MTDPRIETWYDTPGRWRAGLLDLRALLLETPLAESFKWRGPCYDWQDGNVAMPWRMKERFGLSFFKGGAAGRSRRASGGTGAEFALREDDALH